MLWSNGGTSCCGPRGMAGVSWLPKQPQPKNIPPSQPAESYNIKKTYITMGQAKCVPLIGASQSTSLGVAQDTYSSSSQSTHPRWQPTAPKYRHYIKPSQVCSKAFACLLPLPMWRSNQKPWPCYLTWFLLSHACLCNGLCLPHMAGGNVRAATECLLPEGKHLSPVVRMLALHMGAVGSSLASVFFL